jgi:hypothetical protein
MHELCYAFTRICPAAKTALPLTVQICGAVAGSGSEFLRLYIYKNFSSEDISCNEKETRKLRGLYGIFRSH